MYLRRARLIFLLELLGVTAENTEWRSCVDKCYHSGDQMSTFDNNQIYCRNFPDAIPVEFGDVLADSVAQRLTPCKLNFQEEKPYWMDKTSMNTLCRTVSFKDSVAKYNQQADCSLMAYPFCEKKSCQATIHSGLKYNWIEENNLWYKVSETAQNNSESIKYCQDRLASLAIPGTYQSVTSLGMALGISSNSSSISFWVNSTGGTCKTGTDPACVLTYTNLIVHSVSAKGIHETYPALCQAEYPYTTTTQIASTSQTTSTIPTTTHPKTVSTTTIPTTARRTTVTTTTPQKTTKATTTTTTTTMTTSQTTSTTTTPQKTTTSTTQTTTTTTPTTTTPTTTTHPTTTRTTTTLTTTARQSIATLPLKTTRQITSGQLTNAPKTTKTATSATSLPTTSRTTITITTTARQSIATTTTFPLTTTRQITSADATTTTTTFAQTTTTTKATTTKPTSFLSTKTIPTMKSTEVQTKFTALSINTAKTTKSFATPKTSATKDWIQIGKDEYYVNYNRSSYPEAERFCREENASLISFFNPTKYFNILSQLTDNMESYWVGARRQSSSGQGCLSYLDSNSTLTVKPCDMETMSVCSRLVNGSREQILQDPAFKQLIRKMTVDKNETSQAWRKLNSADDKRPSATATGSVGIFIIGLIAALVVASDCVGIKTVVKKR